MPTTQPREPPRHRQDAGSEQHRVLEIPATRLIRAEQAVVVVIRASKVDSAVGWIIVEETVRSRGTRALARAHCWLCDVERPELVQRVRCLGVVAHRVGAIHSEAPSRAFESACLLPEPKEAIATPPAHKVAQALVTPADIVGSRLPVCEQQTPLAGRSIIPLPPQRERRHAKGHVHAQSRGRDKENAIDLIDADARQRKPAQVLLVTTLVRSLAARSHHPRVADSTSTSVIEAHSDHVLLECSHVQLVGARNVKRHTVGC